MTLEARYFPTKKEKTQSPGGPSSRTIQAAGQSVKTGGSRRRSPQPYFTIKNSKTFGSFGFSTVMEMLPVLFIQVSSEWIYSE